MAQTNESTTTASDAINSQASLDYWNKTSADEDGMLGGIPSLGGVFSSVSRVDLQGSRTFLARLGIGTKRDRRRVCSAVDAGAGIGRITKGLLLDVAREVDVIEPVARFTDALRGHPGVRTIFNVGLEDWRPRPGVAYLAGPRFLIYIITADGSYNLNVGKNLVHEVGHWFGLPHTFSDSCSGAGDLISDTPASLYVSQYCNETLDTCPDQPGLDPLHNHMSYSMPECRTEFTKGQYAAMLAHWSWFRAPRGRLGDLVPGLLESILSPLRNDTYNTHDFS